MNSRGFAFIPKISLPNAKVKLTEMMCALSPCALSAHSRTAESCGYPTPVFFLVVHTEPGPIPTWSIQYVNFSNIQVINGVIKGVSRVTITVHGVEQLWQNNNTLYRVAHILG